MKKLLLLVVFSAVLAGTATAAEESAAKPAADEMMPMASEPFAEFVAPEDSLPHLRYLADGLVTLNDRCPVRKVRLNPRMGASYVNGRPVGFC